MTWLITGGAGYIGSHVVRELMLAGERLVVVDDMSTGQVTRLDPEVRLHHVSVHDGARLRQIMREHAVHGVIHLAAKKAVGESVADPLLYYRENVSGLITLLEAVRDCHVTAFVYSSSAAVYGNPDVDLVDETVPCHPLSPYGETKLICERLLAAADRAYGLRHASLRYFNVAGTASPQLADRGGSNVVPAIFARIAAGQAPQIYGDDYPTPDGTCLRDYIDVRDVASAHVSAARYLTSPDVDPDGPTTFNLGRGEGTSVRELITVVQRATGLPRSAPEVLSRRPGDAARCVASTERAQSVFGWKAGFGLNDMITTSWDGWRVEHGLSLHPTED